MNTWVINLDTLKTKATKYEKRGYKKKKKIKLYMASS
jgi:hypothetical protein